MAWQACNVLSDIQIQSIDCDLGLVNFGEDIECQTDVSFSGYTNDTITNTSIIVNAFQIKESTNKLTPFCYNPKITYQHILIKPDYNSTLDGFETLTDDIDIYEGNLGDLSHPINTCHMVDLKMNDSCSWDTCIMKQALEKEYIDFAGINITIYAQPNYYVDECEYNQECEFCNITSTLSITCSKNEQIFICNDERNCSNTNVDIIDNIPFYLYCGDMSCSNMIVNGNNAYDIQIKCYGYMACSNMIINAENATNISIKCHDDNACLNIIVNGNNVDDSNVLCHVNSCLNALINHMHSENITIQCYGDSSCFNMVIQTSYAQSFKLYCADNSCINLTIKANNATLNAECHGHNSCSQLLIDAGNGSNVEIACTGYNTCFNGIVNASHTKNVKLICDGICDNLYMNGQYAEYVSISCNLPYGCSNLYIISSFARQTKIEANKSLINSIFHVEHVYVLIFSGVGDYIGNNITIYASNSDSIIMDMIGYRTFLNSVIYAQSAEDIQIFVDGDYAADNVTIYGQNSDFLQITAKGKRSFTNSSVHGHNVYKLDITCFSELFDGEACLNSNIYLSSKYQSNTFFCRFGCQRLNLYFEDNIDESVFDTITFGECALSQYVNQFIDEWVLYYHAYYINNNIKNYTLSTVYQGYYSKRVINNEGLTKFVKFMDDQYNCISLQNDDVSIFSQIVCCLCILFIIILLMIVIKIIIVKYYNKRYQIFTFNKPGLWILLYSICVDIIILIGMIWWGLKLIMFYVATQHYCYQFIDEDKQYCDDDEVCEYPGNYCKPANSIRAMVIIWPIIAGLWVMGIMVLTIIANQSFHSFVKNEEICRFDCSKCCMFHKLIHDPVLYTKYVSGQFWWKPYERCRSPLFYFITNILYYGPLMILGYIIFARYGNYDSDYTIKWYEFYIILLLILTKITLQIWYTYGNKYEEHREIEWLLIKKFGTDIAAIIKMYSPPLFSSSDSHIELHAI